METIKHEFTVNKLYTSSIPFQEAHPNYDISTLPSWVQDNIELARVYGHKNKCVILPDGRKYHLNNKLNDLTGKEWTFFINSVFATAYPTKGKESYAHHIRKIHPTPKPPQLMRDLICFFTKENELVFDYFMGVGGTLLGAGLCGRKAAGIDLNPTYIDAYKSAAKELELPVFPTKSGDALELLANQNEIKELTAGRTISLILIDPPYSNMMSKEKTGADISIYGKSSTPFTNSDKDLGNMNKEDFLRALKKSVELALPELKYRGYVVIFIKDIQPHKKQTNLLHAEIVEKLNEIPNIYYKGLKIWADNSSRLYPYGYPFSFVANQIHQYILVFRKEK